MSYTIRTRVSDSYILLTLDLLQQGYRITTRQLNYYIVVLSFSYHGGKRSIILPIPSGIPTSALVRCICTPYLL